MKHSFLQKTLLGAGGVTTALLAMLLARNSAGFGDSKLVEAQRGATLNSVSSGLTVAKDPTTGKLRPATAEEMAALQPLKAQARGEGKNGAATLRSEVLANGAVVTTLDTSYDLYNIVSKDADGQLHEACVPGYQLETASQAGQNNNLDK